MQQVIPDKDLQSAIAENVRRLRGDRTYTEIARACSTPEWTCYPATIQQVESCRHTPGACLLVRLAAALGVTPNDILRVKKAGRARLSKSA